VSLLRPAGPPAAIATAIGIAFVLVVTVFAPTVPAGGGASSSREPTGPASGPPDLSTSDLGTGYDGSAPASPPVRICGNGSELDGPATPPDGAVVLPAGDNENMTASYELAPNTTYWLAPGAHTLGTGPYSQFQPDWGDTFVGGPGAVVNGQSLNQFAFTANPNVGSPNVTIEYLTIEDFVSGEGEGVVNQANQSGWVVAHNTVGPNEFNGSNPGGAGVMLGSNTEVEYNCLASNGEYGFSSFGGATNITLSDNEIADNDALGGYDHPDSAIQCGCSGGGKFWISSDVTIEDNYIHDNGDPGIWVDTDNTGFLIAHNFIADNYAEGIIYEISYNGLIENNTLLGNAIGEAPEVAGFPASAIYISESGFDDRVANPFHATSFEIEYNVLSDNWGGVVIWENANRYCSDGSDQVCTLVDPAVYTLASCAAHLGERTPVDYYDGCRWKAQNVTVARNQFSFTAAALGPQCTVDNLCGDNGLFSDYGEAPYAGPAVPTNITFLQHDQFEDNSYSGPWNFEAWSQGNLDNPVNWTVWRANVTDRCSTPGENESGTCDSGFGQDSGSIFNASVDPDIEAFTAAPASVPVGHTSLLTVTAEGGIGSLSFAYVGLPPGCASANSAELTCAPTAPGDFTPTIFVNDSEDHSSEASTSLAVTGVAPTPSPPGHSSEAPGDLLFGLWPYLLAAGLALVAVVAAVAWTARRWKV
jgi:hypothetical protein